MSTIRKKARFACEVVLDTFLDTFVPYKTLSKTGVKNFSVPSAVPGHYVFNEKLQRLQILHLLREAGIENPRKVKAWWSRGLDNFGDELLSYLLAHVAGAYCVYDRKKSFIAIGSIVRFAEDHSYVWGSGIIRQSEMMTSKPRCLAVRGPLTRKKLQEAGVSCPEIYGDPAMLFPLFYKPEKKKISGRALIVPNFKHTDLIPHYTAYEYCDLRVHTVQDIENIINKIASANYVLTSSLHGFIFCVAYGIPVTVFKLRNKGIGGDNVKFDDFCYGVGLEPVEMHMVDEGNEEEFEALIGKAQIYRPDWSPIPLLESLREICHGPVLTNFINGLNDTGEP